MIKYRYGLTREEYMAMFETQGWRLRDLRCHKADAWRLALG
jgi:hypothetical protein